MSENEAEKTTPNFLEALMGMEESLREFREAAEVAQAAMRVRKSGKTEEIHGVVIMTSDQWNAIVNKINSDSDSA